MSTITKSTKVNQIIKKAEDLGLLVKVHNRMSEGGSFESISVTIRRDFEGKANMLEGILTYECITVHAIRSSYDGKARAFKLHINKHNLLIEPTPIKPTRINWWLELFAEDLAHYKNQQAVNAA